jgi:uncharacterized protein
MSMPSLEEASRWYPEDDPVHGFDHVLRVLKLAERIALAEGADLEIVRAAVLLHDAEPPDSPGNERGVHQHRSAEFARSLLEARGWEGHRIEAVTHCIRAHRFRDDREPPQTIEAMVLYDADKLDAIGAIGAARAIAYAVHAGQPAYAPVSQQFIKTGSLEPGEPHSAFHEYVFKLRKISGRMQTRNGRELAEERDRFMTDFFQRLAEEAALPE